MDDVRFIRRDVYGERQVARSYYARLGRSDTRKVLSFSLLVLGVELALLLLTQGIRY